MEAAEQVQDELSLVMMTSMLPTDSSPLPHDLQPPSTDSDEPCTKTEEFKKSVTQQITTSVA